MVALMAASYIVYDPTWYPDLGSTNHITPNATDLQFCFTTMGIKG